MRNLKRTFAFALVLTLVLSMFSVNAFAAPSSRTVIFKGVGLNDGSIEVDFNSRQKELTKGNSTWEVNDVSRDDIAFTVTANPDNGKILTGWKINDMSVSRDDDNSLDYSTFFPDLQICVNEDTKDTEDTKGHCRRIEIEPIFEDAYKLTVEASPSTSGNVKVFTEFFTQTVKDSAKIWVREDSEVTIEAKDKNGYQFISFGGDENSTKSIITFDMDKKKDIVANFRTQVEPKLEFVVDNGDGTYTAHFGYELESTDSVIISTGSRNKVTGGGLTNLNAGQPITFDSGRHYDVFQVDFNGKDLTWKLDGISVTANKNKNNLRFTIRPEMFAYGDIIIQNLSSGGDIVFDGQKFENGAREIYVPCYTYDQPTALAITARPDDGLDFYSWDDNSSTLNPRYVTFDTDWLRTSDMIVRPDPIFETGEVILTVVADDNGQSSISKKIYNAGDIVDISDIASYIIAYSGYDFAGFVEASEDFAIYNNVTLTAKFTAEGTVVITTEPTPTPVTIIVTNDVPKTGDTSADLSIAWILAMILPLLGFAGYKLYRKNK